MKKACNSILVLAALLLPFSSFGVEVEVARDLSQLAQEAKDKKVAILLSVSQEHCPFCHKIKAEILRPMLLSGDYKDKVVIRELLIDYGEVVTDFAGNERSAKEFAYDYKVWVTPTLLFLGPDGKELTSRMLGVQTVEMYGYYVDESIEAALKRLRDPDAEPYVAGKKDIGAWPETWDDLSH